MRCLRDEKGVALVTSIMFTALALVMSLSLLYIITAGIQATGALKRYKTALDATYGGTELMLKDILNASFVGSSLFHVGKPKSSLPAIM